MSHARKKERINQKLTVVAPPFGTAVVVPATVVVSCVTPVKIVWVVVAAGVVGTTITEVSVGITEVSVGMTEVSTEVTEVAGVVAGAAVV